MLRARYRQCQAISSASITDRLSLGVADGGMENFSVEVRSANIKGMI